MRPDVTEKFERSLRSDSTKQMPGEEQLVPMGGGGGGVISMEAKVFCTHST